MRQSNSPRRKHRAPKVDADRTKRPRQGENAEVVAIQQSLTAAVRAARSAGWSDGKLLAQLWRALDREDGLPSVSEMLNGERERRIGI